MSDDEEYTGIDLSFPEPSVSSSEAFTEYEEDFRSFVEVRAKIYGDMLGQIFDFAAKILNKEPEEEYEDE